MILVSSLDEVSRQPAAFYLSSVFSDGDLILARIGRRQVVGRWRPSPDGRGWIVTDDLAIRITGRAQVRILGSIIPMRPFEPAPGLPN